MKEKKDDENRANASPALGPSAFKWPLVVSGQVSLGRRGSGATCWSPGLPSRTRRITRVLGYLRHPLECLEVLRRKGGRGSGLEGEERSNVQTSTNAHTRTKIELLYHETRRVSSRSSLSAPCTPSHLALSPENSEGEHERPSGPTKPDKGKPGLPHNCCPAPRIRRCKVLSQFRPPSCCWQLTTIVVLLLFIANDIAPVTGIVDIIIHN